MLSTAAWALVEDRGPTYKRVHHAELGGRRCSDLCLDGALVRLAEDWRVANNYVDFAGQVGEGIGVGSHLGKMLDTILDDYSAHSVRSA